MTQPTSAVHQNTSSSLRSKHPACGQLGIQQVAGAANAGCPSACRSSRRCTAGTADARHRPIRARMRSLARDRVVPPHVAARLHVARAAGASIDDDLLHGRAALGQRLVDRALSARPRWPPRQPPSAVMTSLAPASSMRSLTAFAENPPNTTEWIAPMRAQACIAITASGISGM